MKQTGRSVTANILALGASDSGFESQRPDISPNSLPALLRKALQAGNLGIPILYRYSDTISAYR